jgi:hypothetical protein
MRIIRQARVAKRRFARGINKTVQGAAQKFKPKPGAIKKTFVGQKPKIGTEGYLSYNPLHNKNVAKGYGFENSLVGGGLARGGMDRARAGRFYQRRAMKLPFAQQNPRGFRNTIAGGVSRFNPMFSAKEYGDIIEFASQAPGIDPALVQNLIMDASRIQQEGQTKVVISQQLFQQIEAALQNYHIQKQQIDGQSAERMQQGFEAGRQSVLEFGRNIEFSAPSMIRGKRGGLLSPTGKKMKALKRRRRAKYAKQQAKGYPGAVIAREFPTFEAGRRGILEFNRFKTAITSVKGIPFTQKPRKIPKNIRDLAVDPDAAFLSEYAKKLPKKTRIKLNPNNPDGIFDY